MDLTYIVMRITIQLELCMVVQVYLKKFQVIITKPGVKLEIDNYWDLHWKNKWVDTDWPTFLSLSNDGFEIVSWGLSIYKRSLYFDHYEKHSLYIAGGNIDIYAGFSFEKKKYGVELGGSVGRLGYDGRFIDVQVDFLTAKFFFIYEDGKLKIDPGFGWVDFGISIDIGAIIEYLKGNG